MTHLVHRALLSLVFLAASSAFAVPERGLRTMLATDIAPHFRSATTGSFSGARGVQIRHFSFVKPGAVAALVLSPGRGESSLKYMELIYDLRHLPFSMFILDHRGQGLSEREESARKDSELGHVESFKDYVADFKMFMTRVVLPTGHSRTYLLAHSMGGTIGALFAAENPGVFDRLVLNAPMLQINTAPYPEPIARSLSRVLTSIGMGARYAPGRKPYDWNEPFEGNDVTRSPDRFWMSQEITRENRETAIGGPSTRWVLESLRATTRIRRLADNAITAPILLFQAGADQIVRPRGQDRFCTRMDFCQLERFEESEHEILQERDEIRSRALRLIEEFLAP